MAGVALWVRGRTSPDGVAAAAAGIKASAGLVVPFLVLGDREPRRPVRWPRLGVLVAMAVLGLARSARTRSTRLSFLNSNQDRSSRFSLPYKTAQLLGAVLPGDRLDYRTRSGRVRSRVRGRLRVAPVAHLARRRSGDACGWATFAVLVASAWLVPWYILWLLPFAALSRDRRLIWRRWPCAPGCW